MILEYLGVFRDLGLLPSALGVIVTVVVGSAAPTGSAVQGLAVSRERLDLRLDALDRVEARLGTLDRIEALLRERLPRPQP